MEALKKVWSVISTVLVVVIVLCAVFLMGSRLLGFRIFTVLSGSMEPQYSVGDMIYVKEVDPTTVKEGDPITFILNEDLVVATHRVISVDAENQRFYTKGDANDTADSSPVHFKNLIGVPQFSIPMLGYVADFVQNSPGMYITIGIGVVLIILVFLPDILNKKKKEEEEDEATAELKAEATAAAEENERLRAEMEKLRAQMQENVSQSADIPAEAPTNTEEKGEEGDK